jgi:6-phosphofructokinase 1
MADIRRIGVITSGGDASGMNAAIRSVVRCAIDAGLEVVGIERGYLGLMQGQVIPMNRRSVSGIINQGGTMLRTIRCEEIKTKEGLERASRTLAENSIDALVVIGGDGSFRGAHELREMSGVPVVGIPASIDNDVWGTDETVGFDSAVNVAVRATDNLRDTAYSHERTFLVEVMGRTRGFIALEVGLCTGAEYTLIPEVKENIEDIAQDLRESGSRGKKCVLIIVAEGYGDTREIASYLSRASGLETRLSVIGYIQRGGSPTARCRKLAALFGSRAVEALLEGEESCIVGLQGKEIRTVQLRDTVSRTKEIDLSLYKLSKSISR